MECLFQILLKKTSVSVFPDTLYKGFCSIVLMAVVDAKCHFRFVSVGSRGQESDGGVWGACELGQMMEAQDQGGPQVLPDPEPLPGSAVSLPHVLVGDDAFPLRQQLNKAVPRIVSHRRRAASV